MVELWQQIANNGKRMVADEEALSKAKYPAVKNPVQALRFPR